MTSRLRDALIHALDFAASQLRCKRSKVVRQAIEYSLGDFEGIHQAIQVLRDTADPVLAR